MATQINGTSQIQNGSIPLTKLASGYSVPTANLTDGANFLKRDGTVAMTASFNFNSNTAINLATPVNATDAANKAYVDQKSGGIGGIHEVNWVQSINIAALTGTALQDGTAAVNDIVLLVAQTTGSQNGPWVIAAGAWSRPTWWASASVQVPNQYFICGGTGTNNKDTKWWTSNSGSITVDTTAMTFVQDSGQVYTQGTGITITGGSISVNFGTTGITAAAGNDSRIVNALQTTALGTGVQTALGVAVGTAGSVVVNGGALGTPSGGTLTNATGLPIAGITGLGTGVGAALAIAAGTGAGFALLSSGVLTAAESPAYTGDVTKSAGSLTTTVNHTSGSGFTKYTDFIIGETPAGTLNSVNTAFTLAATPATVNAGKTSLKLMLNGQRIFPTADYTLSGTTITMLVAPAPSDRLDADYMV